MEGFLFLTISDSVVLICQLIHVIRGKVSGGCHFVLLLLVFTDADAEVFQDREILWLWASLLLKVIIDFTDQFKYACISGAVVDPCWAFGLGTASAGGIINDLTGLLL